MTARRPSTFTLIAAGAFPAELATVVWKLGQPGFDALKEFEAHPEEIARYARMIEALVPHILVRPAVGDTTSDDGATVALEDLSDLDKQFLFFFGQGIYRSDDEQKAREAATWRAEQSEVSGAAEVTVGDLESFRNGAARETPGPDRPAVQPAAVVAGGDPAGEPGGAGV